MSSLKQRIFPMPLLLWGIFCLALQPIRTLLAQATTTRLVLPGVIHLVGIPGFARFERGELILTEKDLVFSRGKKKVKQFVLPYERIRRVQLVQGTRYTVETGWGKTTLVFDYLTIGGGRGGINLKIPEKKVGDLKEWLARFGLAVEEPVAPSSSSPANK